jgi:hypothetical protein
MARIGSRLILAALRVALAAAMLGVIALPARAAAPRALVTIADGAVQALRGEQKFDAVEGFALADNDIVRTTPSARMARIEFADGSVLDLGPATQVLLISGRAAQAQGWTGATAVLLRGWIKLSAGAAPSRLVMQHGVVVGDERGVLLLRAAADGAALAFAESRGLKLLPRSARVAAVAVREGHSWTRDAATGSTQVSARLERTSDMPRALADTLPRRAAQWTGRAIKAANGQAMAATDLSLWQLAEPRLLAHLRPPRDVSSRPNARGVPAHGVIRELPPLETTPDTFTMAPRAAAAPAAEPVGNLRPPVLPNARAASSPPAPAE